MTEKNYTVDELRELDQYPGIAYEQKAHFSRFTHKTITHRDYHRNYSFTTLVLIFFIFAFIGWCWEVFIHIIQDGEFVKRGVLHGPLLPIYGVGGVCGLVLLKKFVDDPVKTFLLLCGICGTVEYTVSWFLETFKNEKYWDYTGYFGNINGRICFEGILIFGFAGCAGIYILAPFLDDLLKKIPKNAKTVISIILLSILLADCIYSKFVPNVGEGITDYCKMTSYFLIY